MRGRQAAPTAEGLPMAIVAPNAHGIAPRPAAVLVVANDDWSHDDLASLG
jgi:hypothetical protein